MKIENTFFKKPITMLDATFLGVSLVGTVSAGLFAKMAYANICAFIKLKHDTVELNAMDFKDTEGNDIQYGSETYKFLLENGKNEIKEEYRQSGFRLSSLIVAGSISTLALAGLIPILRRI